MRCSRYLDMYLIWPQVYLWQSKSLLYCALRHKQLFRSLRVLREKVAVKAGPETVDVFCNGQVIASHRRCFERKQNVYDLKHYLPLWGKKGRVIFYAKPVQDNLPAYFLNWLAAQKVSSKELAELLYLCLEKGFDAVMTEMSNHTAPAQIEDTVLVQDVDLRAYDAFLDRKVGAVG